MNLSKTLSQEACKISKNYDFGKYKIKKKKQLIHSGLLSKNDKTRSKNKKNRKF